MFNGNKHTLYNCRKYVWVKAIAVVIIVTFLCRDIAWANPDLKISGRTTIAVQSFFEGNIAPESFQRVISSYLNSDLFSRDGDKAKAPPTVSTVERLVTDLLEQAEKNGLQQSQLPQVSGDAVQGAVKITFSDGRSLLFFNPKVKTSMREEEWGEGVLSKGERVLSQVAISEYLSEWLIGTTVERGTHEGGIEARQGIGENTPRRALKVHLKNIADIDRDVRADSDHNITFEQTELPLYGEEDESASRENLPNGMVGWIWSPL
ncbi:MAG: hypothetical protein P9L88_02775, partial [Candidatus Tantalella remota]|nr:hypothetical protein [Candidatus Tantalella remota]